MQAGRPPVVRYREGIVHVRGIANPERGHHIHRYLVAHLLGRTCTHLFHHPSNPLINVSPGGTLTQVYSWMSYDRSTVSYSTRRRP